MELSPLRSLQHQALLKLQMKQEQHFPALPQAQVEDQQLLQSQVHQEGTSMAAPAAKTHVALFNIPEELLLHTCRKEAWDKLLALQVS